MTIKLQEALIAVENLPEEVRAHLVDILVSSALPIIQYSDVQIAGIEAGIADAEAGRFADTKEVEVFFARYQKA